MSFWTAVPALGLVILAALRTPVCAQATLPKLPWAKDLQQAQNVAFSQHKYVLVYLHADWCGLCRVLEAVSLRDSGVVRAVGAHFVPWAFNGMDQQTHWYEGQAFKWRKTERIHELAYLLLDRDVRYPAFVILDERGQLLTQLVGYMPPERLRKLLRYYGEEHYYTTSWEDFDALVQE